jgi:hypothetical protein
MGFLQRKGATRPPGTDEATAARVLALAEQTAAQYLADAAREADVRRGLWVENPGRIRPGFSVDHENVRPEPGR